MAKGKVCLYKLLVLVLLGIGLVGCKGGSEPCEGAPYTIDRVVTGFTYEGAVHHALDESEAELGSYITQITLQLKTELAEASAPHRAINFSLFSQATATSCVYYLPEKITAITITSDADYHHQQPAGLPLNHLFGVFFGGQTVDEILAQGPMRLSGMPLDFTTLEQPTAAKQHQFTFVIELDSGSRFTLVTDTVVFN
ncbi:MAG TPA: hypothetical protein VIC08_09565 [Cellvibrionaceae bacterium]